MLNRNFVQRKIKLIQEDLRELEAPAALPFIELSNDLFKMMAVERLLERMITRAIDINNHLLAELSTGEAKIRDYHDTFIGLAEIEVYDQEFAKTIAPSAELRNVLVHEYDEVDEKLVYESLQKALEQYPKYCEAVITFLSKQVK